MNEDFNKKIVEDFGLGNMNPEEQERMIEKIGNLLFESVVERSIDAMDESVMMEFEDTIVASGTDYQKVISFLKSRVPRFDIIVSEEMSRLKRSTSGMFA